MTARNGDEAPVRLGWRGSFCFGCGIGVVVLLVIGLVVVSRGRAIEERKRARTVNVVRELAETARRGRVSCVIESGTGPPIVVRRASKADGTGEDWTGQRALGIQGELQLDGWGDPIIYRSPGPVHRNGWDLWSCGPNGKDDQGTFDDILIGEDVAAVGSGG